MESPHNGGEYLLIWFVYRGSGARNELKDSYSPGILCTVRCQRGETLKPVSERARGYLDVVNAVPRNLEIPSAVHRRELWAAAFRMFLSRPLLGIGPDNFRIRKGEFMEVSKGDATILANSLYLERLSGSGVLGLASFLWLVWEFGQTAAISNAKSLSSPIRAYFAAGYLTGFLSHGFVDYFLKFTPTFLLFWLLLGNLCARTQEVRGSENADRL